MPKRVTTTELPHSMEIKSRRLSSQYADDPLVSLLTSNDNIKKTSALRSRKFSKGIRSSTKTDGLCRIGNVAPRTTSRWPCLQKIDTDTFLLLSDDNGSPKAYNNNNRNALISDSLHHSQAHQPSRNDDKTNHGKVSSLTSKTPRDQNINRQEAQHPPQTLVNKRKSLRQALIPSSSLESKVFISVTGDQMRKYLQVLESPIISKFLKYDICLRVSDKYLLAMAFAYFARAKLHPKEYTVLNFFVALYLAHDVEEDEEDYKYEIFPWALGKLWRIRYKVLLGLRDQLWKRMDYKAIVSRKCCEEIMAIDPDHIVWKRERKEHHAGAIRPWLKERHDDGKLIGPDGSPRHCDLCNYPPRCTESDHDSLSPDNDKVWLQMDSSSSSLEEYTAADLTNVSTGTAAGFSMNEMQKTLMYSSNSTGKNSSGRGRSLSGLTGDTTLDWVDCFSDVDDETRRLHRPEA